MEYKNIPSMETLNGTVVSFDEETQIGIVRFETVQAFANALGGVQGGFLSAMLDDVCGFVCAAASRRLFSTGHMSVDFAHGAKPGDILIGEGSILRIGKRQAIVDGVLRRESDGLLIARATCHQVFLDTDLKK